MRKLLLIALLPLAGCATNMTPEQQEAFRQNFIGGLSNLSQARQPVYYQPAPMPMSTTTVCRSSFGQIVCTSN